jgi:hypothetical protein
MEPVKRSNSRDRAAKGKHHTHNTSNFAYLASPRNDDRMKSEERDHDERRYSSISNDRKGD